MYGNKKCVNKFGLKFSNEKTTWQTPGMDESKVLKFVLEKLCMRVWSEFSRYRSESNSRYLHSMNDQSFKHSYNFLRLHTIWHFSIITKWVLFCVTNYKRDAELSSLYFILITEMKADTHFLPPYRHHIWILLTVFVVVVTMHLQPCCDQ